MNVASVLGKRLVGRVLSSGDRVERNQHGMQQIWYGTVPGKGKAAMVCIGTLRQMLQVQEPPLCFSVWWDTRSLSRPFSMLLRHAAVSFMFIFLETALVALIKAHERQPNGQEDVQHIGVVQLFSPKHPFPHFRLEKNIYESTARRQHPSNASVRTINEHTAKIRQLCVQYSRHTSGQANW